MPRTVKHFIVFLISIQNVKKYCHFSLDDFITFQRVLGNSRGYTTVECRTWSQSHFVPLPAPGLPIMSSLYGICTNLTQWGGGLSGWKGQLPCPLSPHMQVPCAPCANLGTAHYHFLHSITMLGIWGAWGRGDIAQRTPIGHLACFRLLCPFFLHSFAFCSFLSRQRSLTTTFGYLSLPLALTSIANYLLELFFQTNAVLLQRGILLNIIFSIPSALIIIIRMKLRWTITILFSALIYMVNFQGTRPYFIPVKGCKTFMWLDQRWGCRKDNYPRLRVPGQPREVEAPGLPGCSRIPAGSESCTISPLPAIQLSLSSWPAPLTGLFFQFLKNAMVFSTLVFPEILICVVFALGNPNLFIGS